MKLAILCLSLATTALAAPSFFHYLPHYAGSRQQVPPSQVKSPFSAGQPLPQLGIPGAYSMEFIYPHRFPGTGNPAQPFPSHGLLKVSIPQPPGRQSVELYYPYDFSQQRIPGFDANPLPSQDPLQPLQQDQPPPTSQTPTNA
ncbi:secretory calcium-binding phosphoprotein 5 [Brachionichthys hirsutus]|uniref:secretory calcium-binding phosphoprotein 5 n=1 Tax=Brachionichthys hirsutus TaxID=412623 RepID=UPI003604EF3F